VRAEDYRAVAGMTRLAAQAGDAFRTRLWPLPALAVAAAVGLGMGLPVLDASVDNDIPRNIAGLLFGGGPEAARSLLEAIAGSLITVTSLTFSLTVVTLQLASSQFSPRLLRTFTRDRFVHVTLALFLATFAFALTVLRSIRTGEDEGGSFVPDISVTVAFVLAVASVVSLVLFLGHLTREIRVETMMSRVYSETTATMDRVFPEGRVSLPAPSGVKGTPISIRSASSGFLTAVDEGALLKAAGAAGAVIRVDSQPGSFLVAGVPFATAWPLAPAGTFTSEETGRLEQLVNDAVARGFERTSVQDVGFGFRQLVDVAARALSPGINDPTTAVHALGHLSALLCRLSGRNASPRTLTDDNGVVRVLIALPSFEDLLDLAVDQPRLYGVKDPAVGLRILELLREVTCCDQEGRYRQAVSEQLSRMREAVDAGTYTEAERRQLNQVLNDVAVLPVHPPRP